MAKAVPSMIRVLDAERSLRFYRTAFGLEIAGRFPFDGFELIYLSNAESTFEIELTVNHGRSEPYRLGDGYGHAAFVVDDLEAERARFEREELKPGPLREMQRDGKPFGRFFFVEDPDGYKIEVLQRLGRFQ
jgi:lactoylglutathione lyase